MARISTYALDDTLEQDDKIIGTDTSSANATMNFSLQQLGEFFTRTGLADSSTVFTFNVAAATYGSNIPTTIEDGTIYYNFGTAATLTEIIIPIETNTGVATLPFVNAISNEVIILNQAGAGRGLHYGFYDVGQTTAQRDVTILNEVRGYRIPLAVHGAGTTTTGLPTGTAVVTPIGIVGTSQDLTTRLLTNLSNVAVDATEASAFRTAIGVADSNNLAAAVALNTAKISYDDAAAVALNTAKVSYDDAVDVTANTQARHDAVTINEPTGTGNAISSLTFDQTTQSITPVLIQIDDTTNQFADQQALEDFIISKPDFRADIGAGTSDLALGNVTGTALEGDSTTDDISEGTTNIYYTEARADARIAIHGDLVNNPHEVTAAQVGVGIKATSFPDLLANNTDVKEVGTLGVVADAELFFIDDAVAVSSIHEANVNGDPFTYIAVNTNGVYTLAFPQNPVGVPLTVGDTASFFVVPDGGGFTKGLEAVLVEGETIISQNISFGATSDPVAATLALTEAQYLAIRSTNGVSTQQLGANVDIVGIPSSQIYLFEAATVPTHTVSAFYVFKTALRADNTALTTASDWIETGETSSRVSQTTGLSQAAADLRYAPIARGVASVRINRNGVLSTVDTGALDTNGVLTLNLSRHTTGVTPDPLTAISLTAGAVFGRAGANTAPLTPVFTPGPGVSVASASITGGGISAQGLTAVSGTTINVNQAFTLGQSIVFTLTVIGTNADGEAFTETAMATSTLVTRASTPPVITLGTFAGFTASNANHLERFDSGSINFTATPGQPGDFVYITSNSSPNPLVVGTENSAVQTITSTDRYNPPGIDVTTTRTLTPAISVRYGATSSATINTTMIRNFTDASFLSGFPINPIGTQFSITTTDGQRMWFAYDDNETDVTGVFIHGFDNIGIFTRQQIVETGYAIWVSSPVAAGTFDLILR